MSLVKIAPAGWRYYASELAEGREDYYALSAEQPGRFAGRGAEALGLSDAEASALGLERLFGHGTHPGDGTALGRSFSPGDDKVVAGFGVTFSAPKSVSVLWACASAPVAEEVLAAHHAAVAEALVFLDEHAAFTRRGHGGVHQVDTDGLIAAHFTHRTSRAVDPQLHTHVLVANKVRATNGAWLSLDARELYEHQKATGMMYKAALRAELSNRLGLSWTAVDRNGIAEIEGVPAVLCEHFSRRRHEVERAGATLVAEREASLGRALSANERAVCFQLAAYHTRAPKLETDTPTVELRTRWQREACQVGEDPSNWLGAVIGHASGPETQPDSELAAQAIERLRDTAASFGRADAVEVLSTLVTASDAPEMRRRVERLADAVLQDDEVCSLAAPLPAEPPGSLVRRDGSSVIERHGGTRFTTRTTLAEEATVLEAVAGGRDAGLGVVRSDLVEQVLASDSLGEDQRQAVRGLLSGGEQVALLVGPAGAGKSRALGAAREAWQAAGYEVIGLAPSAMAAAALSEQAGLRAETLAKFLLEHGPGAGGQLGERSVVVLDEASMARSDDLARLMRLTTRADAKLVLVGDHRQLGAVGPGGLFATLVSDHGAHELETLRRFEHAWEAAATRRLRAGDASVLAAYRRRGRITSGSREDLIEEAFRAWRQAREGGVDLLVMAGDNATADELARRCRADRVARGEVAPNGAALASGTAGVGDEIVTLRNDRRLSRAVGDFVRNGERWLVLAHTHDGGLDVAPLRGGGSVNLPASYVAKHVALGYAMTIHKAQGTTSDRAVVLVDEQMSAEQLYVAMSRGRKDNRALVVCSGEVDGHGPRRDLDAIEQLARVMRRSSADRSAHDVMRTNLGHFEDLQLLGDLLAEAERAIERGAGPDRSREIAALEARADVESARAALRLAEEQARLASERRAEIEVPARGVGHRRSPAFWRRRPSGSAQRPVSAPADELDILRREERPALDRLEDARRVLVTAERAADRLVELRHAEELRRTWIREHPAELGWAAALRERRTKLAEERVVTRVLGRARTTRAVRSTVRSAASPAPAPQHECGIGGPEL